MTTKSAEQQLIERFSDWRWRLDNLYSIKTEKGKKVRFRLNRAQADFWDQMHYLNIILKARQLGFTTFIQLFMLDKCLFTPNISAGVIAHRRQAAEDIFADIIKTSYDSLDEAIRAAVPAEQDSARKLSFANGSSIRVDTSLRSGAFQYLHVSEFGKLCAQFPERAREVMTGALNTIHAGQVGFIESTAEGREGAFFEQCQIARNLKRQDAKLTKLDWKFHFYNWTWRDDYRLDPESVVITSENREYFEKIEAETGHPISPEQRAWYVKKKVTQGEDMKREFPSTPDEAFEASVQGAYFSKEMARAREDGRIARVPWQAAVPVNTFWDLGRNDEMVIWFHQRVGKEHRLIDYYENSGEAFPHYAKVLKGKPYAYGMHYLPHDVEHHELISEQSRKQALVGLGIKPIKAVRRAINAAELGDDIESCRTFLGSCWIDEERCADGIKALDSYRKEWNEKLGCFNDRPLHDWASHGADAFRTGAVGFKEDSGSFEAARKRQKRNQAWIR